MKQYRPEAKGAVQDALATSIGQASCFLASLIFSIFVPRLLGASVYGEWMLFRGMVMFWLTLSMLGDREVISSFYLPRREAGDHEGAGRVFKSLAVFRLMLVWPAMAGVLFMLFSSSSMFRTWEAAFCIAGSVVCKCVQTVFSSILFGHRRLGMLAIIDTLQAVLLPVGVMAAFDRASSAMIPLAALLVDLAIVSFVLAVSGIRREWPRGWLNRSDFLIMLRYALAVSLATSVILALNNALLYLMSLRGFSADVLGRVGLATRCAWVGQAALAAVASALMPVLVTVQMRHGAERMISWQNFLSRLGLTLLLLAAGNVLLMGTHVVGLIWGGDFRGVTPLLAVGLLAVAALWVGSQWIRQFLMQRRTRVYMGSAVVYSIVLIATFYAVPRDEQGWAPMLALLAAGTLMSVFAGFHAARNGASWTWLFRFIPAMAWLSVAWWWGRDATPGLDWALRVAGWNIGVVALILLARAVGISEVFDLVRLFRQRAGR